MESLRDLFWLHYEPAGPLIPLWDEWMPKATLWPALGSGSELDSMRRRWASALARRTMNREGYIHTHQHDGLAHAEGWPFPFWTHAGGIGWHFVGTGVPGYDAQLTQPTGWSLTRGEAGDVTGAGWVIHLLEANAELETPAFAIDATRSPWLRLNWRAVNLDSARCYVEWTSRENPEFGAERRAYFDPPPMPSASDSIERAEECRTMIPLYRQAQWRGTITGFRIGFENKSPAIVAIKSFHTAPDTRHNINNLNFIRGSHDYFMWSRDVEFLRSQIGRIRASMEFVEREFQTRERKCIYTTWPGHEGRSGVRWVDGKKLIVPGEGIGSNYWDLLPFGGEDALATVYYYDALGDLAELETEISRHPEWEVATDNAYEAADLLSHADDVKAFATQRFWNGRTQRFGTIDLDGKLHDYGFTFLNTEAVYYGLATPAQAQAIYDWLSGKRLVEGDTSTGDDIYHWRFGPRSTTLRNTDYYVWNWSAPETIPFGYQVQDGGAVLGWSFHDLMMRLQVAGPDDAARRLSEIVAWFDDTQREGGYRAYYAKDSTRGTLQGSNVAGGLGLDREFFESILVPQVMLYGFLGFRPTADGFAINPKLPSDWPELTITRIHLHDHVLDIKATSDGRVLVSGSGPHDQAILVEAPDTIKVTAADGVKLVPRGNLPSNQRH